jgi:hypothetical protein
VGRAGAPLSAVRVQREHHPTKRDHPSDKDARQNKELEHHPTKGDHPSDKDARQNKELERFPRCLTDSIRSENALAAIHVGVARQKYGPKSASVKNIVRQREFQRDIFGDPAQ